ncbi:hypothetical protein UPYG_G00062730 [Umbra pygmaea]|uniref:Uncharacterized protein n=1 Tax=Umbra pygmaea TaxID=75934 RepID=A0ABD0XUK1_UMBPY
MSDHQVSISERQQLLWLLQETLLECLRNKFKNERSPLVNLKTVQEMKKKFGTKRQRSGDPVPLEDIAGQERAKRRRENAIQISSEDIDRTREIVLDLEVVGEDELSFKEHISSINNELRRRQPDFLNIKDRMKRSLYQRVEHMGKPTEEEMEMFPFLQVPLLMHHEMRLRFGQDLELNLQDALNMMTPNILRVARSGNQRGLLSTLLGTETNKDLERSAAILILPILFKESSKFLYCLEEEPTSSFPTITFHDAENPLHAVKASVKMDGVTITSGEMDVPQALQCLLEVLFQVSSEADALNWFPHYALMLRPFYEILPLPNPEVVQPIVDSLRSHPDWSSAHIAVFTGLKECLKHNYVQSQINARDGSGQTPLHLACDWGDVGCVRALLEECQARTDVKDKNGETPMHCAAKQDSPAIIQVCTI